MIEHLFCQKCGGTMIGIASYAFRKRCDACQGNDQAAIARKKVGWIDRNAQSEQGCEI